MALHRKYRTSQLSRDDLYTPCGSASSLSHDSRWSCIRCSLSSGQGSADDNKLHSASRRVIQPSLPSWEHPGLTSRGVVHEELSLYFSGPYSMPHAWCPCAQADEFKKKSPAAITGIKGRQILDSRGNPTVGA